MRNKNSVAASVMSLASVAVIVGGASAAFAATKTGDTDIPCNGKQKYVNTIVRSGTGPLKVKQVDSTDDMRTSWKGVSSAGNSLEWKMTGTGDTVPWAGVKASTYSMYAKKYVPSDCAWLWGATGNYNVEWKFVTP